MTLGMRSALPAFTATRDADPRDGRDGRAYSAVCKLATVAVLCHRTEQMRNHSLAATANKALAFCTVLVPTCKSGRAADVVLPRHNTPYRPDSAYRCARTWRRSWSISDAISTWIAPIAAAVVLHRRRRRGRMRPTFCSPARLGDPASARLETVLETKLAFRDVLDLPINWPSATCWTCRCSIPHRSGLDAASVAQDRADVSLLGASGCASTRGVSYTYPCRLHIRIAPVD